MQDRKLGTISILLAVTVTAALAAPAVLADSQTVARNATYQVTFIPSWNPETHPVDYPLSHAKHGLLTPMVGATHGRGYAIFKPGNRPTPGLEKLSEMGAQDVLSMEIERTIKEGRAGRLIKTDMGSPGPVHPSVALEFEADTDFPMVSLVGMIAPSPDWFYGVSGVDLYKDGDWVPRLSVDAYAWDSGGDAGDSYMAQDQDLNPKESTRYADAASFKRGGKRVPVGTFVFKRVPPSKG